MTAPRRRCAIIARVTTRPGRRDEVLEVFRLAVACTREEAGTLVCTMHVDRTDPNVIWFYDEYVDDEAMEAHRRNPAIARITAGLDGLLAHQPETFVLDLVAER